MRGFEVAKGFQSIELPKRKTRYSAGYDIMSIENVTINSHDIVLVKTGIKAYMDKKEVLKIYPRSSLAVKKNLNLANNVGIIDADYYSNPDNDGHIMIPLFNFGDKAVVIEKGERIAQGIFETYLTTDDDNSFEERLGGFGSTNK